MIKIVEMREVEPEVWLPVFREGKDIYEPVERSLHGFTQYVWEKEEPFNEAILEKAAKFRKNNNSDEEYLPF